MLKNKRILKLVLVFTLILMSVFMLTGCEFGKNKKGNESTFEEPIKNIVEGLSEANSEKLLNAFPSFVADYMKSSYTDEFLKMTLEDAEEQYGANIKMSYEIIDKEEISEDDIKDTENDIKENFEQEVDITKGYNLKVKIITKGDNSQDEDEDTFSVFEINGKWYLFEL